MPQILSGMGFGIDGPSSLVRILHPYDTRSCRWAMHRDITDLKTVNEIVPLFIPSGNSKDPIWEQLGRALLEGVFQTFILSGKPWTLRDVCNAMRSIERPIAVPSRASKGTSRSACGVRSPVGSPDAST